MNDEREFLERSLADLEAERAAGDISDDDYKLLRDRYRAKLNAPEAVVVQRAARNPAKVVGACVLVAALAIGAGLAVARFAGSREPGQTITGNLPADREPAEEEVPNARELQRAAELAAEGDVIGALEVYDEVLAVDPEHVAALTYKGWLLRNVGTANGEAELARRGVELLERASQLDPTSSETWLFLGIVYYRDQGETERAVDALRLAIANDPIPDVEAAARELLAEIEDAS